MEYIIAAFSSRNVTIKAYNYLVSNGITCALVSTPRAANVGCGLSVRFDASYLGYLQGKFPDVETFAGFFRVRNTGGRTIVVRV